MKLLKVLFAILIALWILSPSGFAAKRPVLGPRLVPQPALDARIPA